jgi:hypothetical protein
VRDAAFVLSAAGTSNANGTAILLNLKGSGQLVLQPAAVHVTLQVAATSEQGTSTFTQESIQVGGEAYTRAQFTVPGLGTSGSSTYTAVASTAPLTLLPQHDVGLNVVGEDTVDGQLCWHLAGLVTFGAESSPTVGGAPRPEAVPVDLWIRENDYYLARLRSNGLPGLGVPTSAASATGPDGSTGSGGSLTVTVDFTRYNTGVTISPPPPNQIAR